MKLEGSLGMKVPSETNYLHIYIKYVVLQHLLKSKWKLYVRLGCFLSQECYTVKQSGSRVSLITEF